MRHILFSAFIALSCMVRAQDISFKQYTVPIYKGHRAKLRINGNATAEQFRTVITDTYYSKYSMPEWQGKTGQNFAGHFCLVFWGCGSPCKSSAIVDLKTGKVYDGVSASFEYKFKQNSRLIITDPNITPEQGLYKTEYWVWNDVKKKFAQIKVRK